MIQFDLVEKQLFVLLRAKREELVIKVECAHLVPSWLVCRVVILRHIRVLKCLLDGDSSLRVEYKHFLEQVDSIGVFGGFEKFIKIHALALGKIHHELLVVFVVDFDNQVHVRVANQVRNHVHQVLLIVGGQQGFPLNELGEDAADRPNVDSAGVLFPRQDYFGRTVPASGDVVRQKRRRSH